MSDPRLPRDAESVLKLAAQSMFDLFSTMSEGMMLDANVWVRCVDVKAGHVLVRQVDAPQELKDLDFEDLK